MQRFFSKANKEKIMKLITTITTAIITIAIYTGNVWARDMYNQPHTYNPNTTIDILNKMSLRKIEKFQKADVNQDGQLTWNEYLMLRLGNKHDRLLKEFEALDGYNEKLDGTRTGHQEIMQDNRVSLTEYNKKGRKMLKKYDTNNDGVISENDF